MENDLKRVIAYSPDLLDNDSELMGIILEKFVDEELNPDVLVMAHEEGIVDELRKIKEKGETGNINVPLFYKYGHRIANKYDVDDDVALMAVFTWADALGLIELSPSLKNEETAAENLVEIKLRNKAENELEPESKPETEAAADEFDWYIAENEVYIKKFIGFENEKVVVPARIEGRPVVSIGKGAFENCRSLKTVVLPEGLKYIGNRAFYRCWDLESINLPSSLESIGEYLADMISVPPDEGDNYGSVFKYTAIKEINIPNGIKYICPQCFDCCKKLMSVKLPHSLEYICYGAFWGDESLKDIKLTPLLKSIGDCAFRECSSLEYITIPYGLKKLNMEIFTSCKALTGIYFTNSSISLNEPRWCDNVETHILLDLVIYCEPGSTAMEYARKKGFMCGRLPEEIKEASKKEYEALHIEESKEPEEPTETPAANSGYSTSSQPTITDYSSTSNSIGTSTFGKKNKGYDSFTSAVITIGGFLEAVMVEALFAALIGVSIDDNSTVFVVFFIILWAICCILNAVLYEKYIK